MGGNGGPHNCLQLHETKVLTTDCMHFVVACQCEILDSNCIIRQQRWREVCAKFYFDQDEAAKCLLDYFEAKKVDEIRCI